jgi:biotin synthase-related radical SAM superfamily protein
VPPFLRKIVELRDIVEAIMIQKNIALVTRGDDILQIGRDLAMHIKIYKKLEKQRRLSKRQKRMMNVLSGLVEDMKTAKIVAKAEEISLAFWSLFNGDATQDIFKRINKSIV